MLLLPGTALAPSRRRAIAGGDEEHEERRSTKPDLWVRAVWLVMPVARKEAAVTGPTA